MQLIVLAGWLCSASAHALSSVSLSAVCRIEKADGDRQASCCGVERKQYLMMRERFIVHASISCMLNIWTVWAGGPCIIITKAGRPRTALHTTRELASLVLGQDANMVHSRLL